MRIHQKIVVTNRMLGWFSVFILWISIRDANIIALEEPHSMLSSFSAPPESSTNPTLLHVNPVNAAASRASSLLSMECKV